MFFFTIISFTLFHTIIFSTTSKSKLIFNFKIQTNIVLDCQIFHSNSKIRSDQNILKDEASNWWGTLLSLRWKFLISSCLNTVPTYLGLLGTLFLGYLGFLGNLRVLGLLKVTCLNTLLFLVWKVPFKADRLACGIKY